MDSTLNLCLIGGVGIFLIGLTNRTIRWVPESHRLAIYRLGSYIGDKGPGLVFLAPVIDRGQRVLPVGDGGKSE